MLKKLLICGASLLMVASVGTGINNVSAKRVHHHIRKTAVSHKRGYKFNNVKRNKQFKSVQGYLKFVAKYNRTHSKKWNSYYLRHLGRHMNYLSYSQKKFLFKQLAKVNKIHFARHHAKRTYKINHHKRGKKVMTKKHFERKANKSARKHFNSRKPNTEVTTVKTYTPKKSVKKPASNENQSSSDNNTQATPTDETDGGKYYSWDQLNNVLDSDAVANGYEPSSEDQKIENTIYHNLNDGNYTTQQLEELDKNDGSELSVISQPLYNHILGSEANGKATDDFTNNLPLGN